MSVVGLNSSTMTPSTYLVMSPDQYTLSLNTSGIGLFKVNTTNNISWSTFASIGSALTSSINTLITSSVSTPLASTVLHSP